MLGRSTNVAALQADADVAAWVAAVIAAGGTVSAAQQASVTTLVQALKGCGAWALTDDYALYAVENQTQALVTLKMRITQTLAHLTSSDPSFVGSRGFLGNKDGFVNTGWDPTSGSPQYARDSARFGVWIYSAASTSSTWVFGHDGASTNTGIELTNVGAAAGVNSAGTSSYTSAGGFTTGWHVAERTGSAAEDLIINAVQVAASTASSNAVASQNFTVLQINGFGGPTDAGVSAAVYGGPLTSAAMYAAEYAALRAYMTSVGVP